MSFGSKSLPPPTADEQRRMDMARDRGCICCRMRLGVQELAEIHHLVMPGKRYGHRFTVALCAWHHRAVSGALPGHTRALRGPSLAEGSKPFHAMFGSDAALLSYQDRLIRWDDGIAWPSSKIARRAAA
jgi:hypothetical protein